MSTESNSGTVCDILVKAYLGPDLFLDFRDLCKMVGTKHSGQVRNLVAQWVTANRRLLAAKGEGPKGGQVVGVPGSFGSRVNYGGAPARLRP